MYSSNHGFSGPRPNTAPEVGVGLLDDGVGALHGLVVLAADLDDPVLVGLRGHRDRVVGVQQQIAAVVARQELVDLRLGRHQGDGLRVGQERAVGRDGQRQEHAAVLGDPIGDQRGVERLLRGVDPAQHPAEVAHEQRVVVLDAERARIVERAVADQGDHGHAQGRRHHQALHRVGPAHAGRAAEDARARPWRRA